MYVYLCGSFLSVLGIDTANVHTFVVLSFIRSFFTLILIVFLFYAHYLPSAPRSKRTYDLNTQLDGFLRTYAGSPFPEAVDANEKELNEVKISVFCCCCCIVYCGFCALIV